MTAETALERSSDHPAPSSSASHPGRDMDGIAHQLALRVSEQLPTLIDQLISEGHDPDGIPWQLECSLTAANGATHSAGSRFPIAAVNLAGSLGSLSPTASPFRSGYGAQNSTTAASSHLERAMRDSSFGSGSVSALSTGDNTPIRQPAHDSDRPIKRRRTTTTQQTSTELVGPRIDAHQELFVEQPRNEERDATMTKRKKTFDNPAHQPSTLQKYISGVWESLYSGPKIDLAEVVEQWQAIESDGQPKLLTDVEHEVATRSETGVCK